MQQATEYLLDVLRTQGPFDGVLAFSQGGIAYSHFYRITQLIDQPQSAVSIPRFLVNIATPLYPTMKFEYKGTEYGHLNQPIFDFPSIHLKGTKDRNGAHLNSEKYFKPSSEPQVVVFEDGHRFPRLLSEEGFGRLKSFIKAQFVAKNGSDLGWEVDYEKYDFEII